MLQLWNNQPTEWQLLFAKQDENTPGGKLLELTIHCDKNGVQTLTVGLGKEKDFTSLIARRAVAQGINELKKISTKSVKLNVSVLKELLGENTLPVAVEAARLALFKQENWKSEDSVKEFTVYIDAAGIANAEEIFKNSLILAECIVTARNLANEPANKLTPEIMANRMVEEAKKAGLGTEVLDEKEMAKLGMGSLLAVGNSSGNLPKMITLSYMGNPGNEEILALVGKGVTFDTGGYSLKPSTAMVGMKGDMAGAGAVFSAILAVAAMKLKINVLAVIPAVENRISPTSFLPSDVLKSMSGRTIEISNTDAEGRLILVDAITYAIEKKGATKIVDIATLTGAVVTMLGHTTAGLSTNNEELYATFMKAAEYGGEQYWKLPNFPEYRKMIESPVADLHNMSNDGCGTITAGMFIETFAEGKPWIHLDIAGTGFVDRPRMEFQSKGGTGAGVTSLYHLCRLLAEQ